MIFRIKQIIAFTFAGLLALVLTAIITSVAGYGSESYWTKTDEALKPLPTRYLAVVSGGESWGRSIRLPKAGICGIEVMKSLPLDLRQCVENHERHECAGYSHAKADRPQFGIDCGDGWILGQSY